MNMKNLLIACSFMFCLNVCANDPLDLGNDYKFNRVNLKCVKLKEKKEDKEKEDWIPDIDGNVYQKATDKNNASDFCWRAVKSLLDKLDSIEPNSQLDKIKKMYEIASTLQVIACQFSDEECVTLRAMGYNLMFRLLEAGSKEALWDLQEECDLMRDCLKYVQRVNANGTLEALSDSDFFNIQNAFQRKLENYSGVLDKDKVQRIVNESLRQVLGVNHNPQAAMEIEPSDNVVHRTESTDDSVASSSPLESPKSAGSGEAHGIKRLLEDNYPPAKKMVPVASY